MRFCFVILHYKTADDTIQCVESIKRLEEESEIIIVDNYSDNGSIEHIESMYCNDDKIVILKNKKNLGFASGNNVGYSYAKNVLHADFIAISNNDIIVDSKDFIHSMMHLYEETEYYVAGPDIESLVDHKHQNPMRTKSIGLKKAKKEIIRYRMLLLASRLNVYDFLKKDRNNGKNHSISNPDNLLENVKLHGSFIVFSPGFIAREDEAFRTGTFLYMEETILYEYCRAKSYKMVFTPFVKVFHKEDSSTNALFQASKQKREFVFENMIMSLKVYVEILSRGKDNE